MRYGESSASKLCVFASLDDSSAMHSSEQERQLRLSKYWQCKRSVVTIDTFLIVISKFEQLCSSHYNHRFELGFKFIRYILISV